MNFKELKYIAEYPRYAASADGNIYSFKSNRYLKPITKDNGYQVVSLRKNGKSKQLLVHRIIACLFCKKEKGYNQVNHINGVKHDNRASNLEWCDSSHNMKHAYETGLAHNQIGYGENNPKSKIDDEAAREIFKAIAKKESLKSIASRFHINRSTLGQMSSGRTWTHIAKEMGYCPKFGFQDK